MIPRRKGAAGELLQDVAVRSGVPQGSACSIAVFCAAQRSMLWSMLSEVWEVGDAGLFYADIPIGPVEVHVWDRVAGAVRVVRLPPSEPEAAQP